MIFPAPQAQHQIRVLESIIVGMLRRPGFDLESHVNFFSKDVKSYLKSDQFQRDHPSVVDQLLLMQGVGASLLGI